MEKNAKMLAFVEAVSESLIAGNKYPVAGFGTFSTCSRKDKNGNIVCTIAMFRASKELREFFLEGRKPELADQHRAPVSSIIERMKIDNRAEVPGLGFF